MGTIRKPELYEQAKTLRGYGFSYTEINDFVPICKGTISRWCRGSYLTKEQHRCLMEKKKNNSFIQEIVKRAKQDEETARLWAEEQTAGFSKDKQVLLFTGVTLYWAEGTRRLKDGGGGSLEFTNTDPKMIRIIIRFFKEIFKVEDKKIRLMIRISKEGNLERATQYWLGVTGLSQNNLVKPELLNLQEKSRSLTKYPNGMCRIIVHNSSAFRKLIALIEKFSNFMAE